MLKLFALIIKQVVNMKTIDDRFGLNPFYASTLRGITLFAISMQYVYNLASTLIALIAYYIYINVIPGDAPPGAPSETPHAAVLSAADDPSVVPSSTNSTVTPSSAP